MPAPKKARKVVSEDAEVSVSEEDSFVPSSDEEDAGSDFEPEAKPKSSSKKRKSTGKENAKPKPRDEDVAARILRSLGTTIRAQMVYKKSLKGSSSRITAEVPNLTLEQVKGMLGSELFGRASNGPKQVAVQTTDDDLQYLFGDLSKSLRYVATLVVRDGALKLTYSKENQILKVAGACIMLK
ncbi:hypothetical protein HYH03_000740 [Edaphochlamys debaryana]|uniref:Uncharacterized protein n=1 Tax=Edaphochlamys debaryana TaxID=47281 RepID=A0A836C7Q2_9CHLO|nr:hypothetical protein HYH03_000740 [Edaphochlamys debaryana]|eukprot:KAG2502254.1 hypothetical protein HYH03_000740 [Edaphochlamys debaryana]